MLIAFFIFCCGLSVLVMRFFCLREVRRIRSERKGMRGVDGECGVRGMKSMNGVFLSDDDDVGKVVEIVEIDFQVLKLTLYF